MKYFTAERYLANQTEDEDAADKAIQDWEEQIRLYQQRLREIDGKLPESVKKFITKVSLHDADFDEWAEIIISPPMKKLQLVIKQTNWGDNKFVCVLRYKLAHPCQVGSFSDYPNVISDKYHYRFPSENREWLYDEFDCIGDELFVHNILLSNGTELNIVFTEFQFIFLPIDKGLIDA